MKGPRRPRREDRSVHRPERRCTAPETVRYSPPGVEQPTELPAQVFRDWETGERVPGANVAPVVNEDHGKRISRFALVESA